MDIPAARLALANAAATLDGLTGLEYAPDDVEPDVFFVSDYTVDYNWTFNSYDSAVEFTALLLVSRTHDRESQRRLDGYLSPIGDMSIKRALEAARGAPGECALDGACDDFRVSRIQGYRWYQHAGSSYVGAEIIIPAWGKGDVA